MACPLQRWRGAAEPFQQAMGPSGKRWQSRSTGFGALCCVMVTSGNQISFIGGDQLQSKVGDNPISLMVSVSRGEAARRAVPGRGLGVSQLILPVGFGAGSSRVCTDISEYLQLNMEEMAPTIK